MKTNLLPCLGLLAALSAVPAAGEVYYVEEGADAQAIQDALWCVAMDVATNDAPGEVVVPDGTYVLSSNLRIYPGTTLTHGTNAFVRYEGASGGSMLLGCHLDDNGNPCSGDGCPHGGYSQCHDVVVQGGYWDRNSSADELSQAFVFRHASGITIRDMDVVHCSNHHFNLSGSEDVVVDNVCFSGQVRYTGHSEDFWLTYAYGDEDRYNPIEAIHLDYLDSVGEASARPLDKTPARNVLVTNCVFDGVFSCVGVHHLPQGDPASNLRIADCTFRNPHGFAVYMYGVTNGKIENCDQTGGLGILLSNQSSTRVAGNDVSGSKQYGVFARNGSHASIVGNRFANTTLRAIHVEQSTTTATDNTIATTGDNAILLNGSGKAVVDRNVVTGAGKNGILAMAKTSLYARDNTITSAKSHGIYSTGGSSLNAARNTIRSAQNNGIVLDGGSATLANNKIVSSKLHGVYAMNSAKVTATSNTIETPGACGFSFTGKAKLTANGKNVVKNPAKQGILLSSAAASSISGSQISGSGADGIRIVATDGCTVSKNTVTGVKNKLAGIVLERCRSGTVSENTVSGTTGHGIRLFGTKAVPCTATVSKNKSTGAASPYSDIVLGDWCRNCKVLDNVPGRKRVVISTNGTSGNTYRPLGTKLSKLTKKSKNSILVQWTKRAQIDGYDIQYGTDSKFKNAKTVSVSASAVSTTLTKLTARKKYYVRIRTYQKVGGKKYGSSWSAAMALQL